MSKRVGRMGSEGKMHYKIYKSGKQWVTAGITVFSVGLGLAVNQVEQAQAATNANTDGADISSTKVSSGSAVTATNTVVLKTSTDATSATSAKEESSSESTVSTSSASQATSASTTSSTSSTATKSDNTNSDAASSSSVVATQSSVSNQNEQSASSSASSVSSSAISNQSSASSVASQASNESGTESSSATEVTTTPVTSTATSDVTTAQSMSNTKSEMAKTSVNMLNTAIEAAAATSVTTTDTNAKTTTTTITDSNGVTLTIIDSYGKTMTYKTNTYDSGTGQNGLNDLQVLLEASGDGVAEGDGLATMYVQDRAGNYLTDEFGQRVNLLYTILNGTDSNVLANYLTVTYTNVAGTESTDVSSSSWKSQTNAGTYKFTLTQAGIQSISDLLSDDSDYYDLPAGETITDFIPTDDSTADYSFQIQIAPATLGLVNSDTSGLNQINVSKDKQNYNGTISQLPTKIRLFDGTDQSQPAIEIKNGIVTTVTSADGSSAKVGDVVFTSDDFLQMFNYTYTSNTDNLTGADAGKYTISLSAEGLAKLQAYLGQNFIVASSATTSNVPTLTIVKSTLAVNAANDEVTYDGKSHTTAVTIGTNYDGITADDYTTIIGTNAGEYTITPTYTGAKAAIIARNYTSTVTAGTLIIDKAAATITIPSKTYWNDGTAKNLTANVDGTVNGETLNYSLTDGMSTTGTKTITATYDEQDGINRNYAIKVMDGTLTIGDVAVQYLYEHTNADGTTQVDATATGTVTHGSDESAADYLNYTTTAKPKTGYTLVSDNTGLAANGTLANAGGTVVYIYHANTETATVTYVDQLTGKTIKTDSLDGSYGTTDSYATTNTISNYEKIGYKLVTSNFPANGVIYDEDGVTKNYIVILKHKTVIVTPDNPGTPGQPIDASNPEGPKYPAGTTAQDLTKEVSQTIKYQYKNGTSVGADNVQTVTFNRVAVVDEVDGTVTYMDWLNGTVATGRYITIESPVIMGYTADKLSVAGNDAVANTDQDTTVVVTYNANPETATVTYVDATTGKTLDVASLTGDFSSQSDYQTMDTIANYVKNGYELVSDGYPTSGLIFDEDGVTNNYVVTLKHKLVTVTSDNPGTPGQPIDASNPDGPKYPEGTSVQDLVKKVSQTIHYQYAGSDESVLDIVQTVTFKRNAIVDEVTGNVTYTDWLNGASTTGGYVTIETPNVAGYTADKLSVLGNSAVSSMDQDTTVIVTYTAN
ncbi:mucin-binding protein, partial [Lactiplantibacillus herbarum]|uniref:mucin-binding protein n=1 Tax=Lactiplantibacillus herbarum TaxID=1670446 RepID=UPI00064F56B2